MNSNRILVFRGEAHCKAEWARRVGLHPITLHYRLKGGWSLERALTEPVKNPWRGTAIAQGAKSTFAP
jgi:hypothetical protein